MGEYEPHDSRKVTLTQDRAPGEPPRTGPREDETREGQTPEHGTRAAELVEDGRGEDGEATVSAAQREAQQRDRAMQIDTDELNAGEAAARANDA